MRHFFLLLTTLLFLNKVNGQDWVPCHTLPYIIQEFCYQQAEVDTFDIAMADSSVIAIDTVGCSVWQKGNSYKMVFDSISDFVGMVTDTVSPYGMGLDCGFTVSSEFWTSYHFATSFLLFEHKYDTDSLLDGGFVEFSCDSGATWNTLGMKHFVDDGIYVLYHNYVGLWNPDLQYPFDEEQEVPMLYDSIPAFTGSSEDWIWSAVQFTFLPVKARSEESYVCDWDGDYNVQFRFKFQSDSVETGRAGWMIRNVIVGYSDIGSDISDVFDSVLRLYPNPSNTSVSIELPSNPTDLEQVMLHDLSGREVLRQHGVSTVDVSALPSGIYTLTAITGQGTYRQRFVRE